MSAPRDDGGPAFPAPDAGEEHFSQKSAYMGMTLRDYFAAKALPAVIAGSCAGQHHPGSASGKLGGKTEDLIAMDAYAMADAMLNARQQ